MGQHEGLGHVSGRSKPRGADAAPRSGRLASSTPVSADGTPGEPYTKAPGTKFEWWRARMLGGRTNHWGRISLRFGPDDFRRKSVDGLGDDWPVVR